MKKRILDCPSLVDVVRLRAVETPDKVSCIFLNRADEERMTYKTLDEHARNIAFLLQQQGAQPGDRILLLFSSGLPLIQAFFGCLYAGCVAVPIYPPAQEKLRNKAHRIILNCKPRFVLMTSDQIVKYTSPNKHNVPCYDDIPCLTIDNLDNNPNSWHPVKDLAQELAFLQYTSGSTMHPKGVMVSHNNLLDNIHKIYTAFAMNDKSVGFSWLPPHHDMGLIGAILTPIYGGIPIIMMSPFSFLQNPLSWLKNITQYQVTISASPNFAYDYCVKRIKEEKKEGLNLSSWQVASNGAEPVRKETMQHFYNAFKDYGFRNEAFYPCYGLAEATLLVTGGTPGQPYKSLNVGKEHYQDHRVYFVEETDPTSHSLVSCGKMIQEVKIVDPDSLTLCSSDQVGEIWVKSNSVAQGYWQLDEETRQAFQGYFKEQNGQSPYLRTGDLGFIHEGELYVTGRIKDLIIVYGKNHYPQDIEYSLLHSSFHDQLGKCAAFVIQNGHEYQLTVMCEIKDKRIAKQQQDQLFNSIFELIYQIHQLETHTIVLIPLKAMPHTTSGKIRRNFCRSHLLDNTIPVIARWELAQIGD